MRKLWAITLKELRKMSDRSLLVVMFAAPIALATIIGLSFGSAFGSNNSSPIEHIPLAVVNQDTGMVFGNYGQLFVDIIAPDETAALEDTASADSADSAPSENESTTEGEEIQDVVGDSINQSLDNPDVDEAISADDSGLGDLFDVTFFEDAQAARDAVDNSEYSAAIIIPEGFTAGISPNLLSTQIMGTSVEVYTNPGRPLSSSITRSVAESIVNRLATGNIALASVLQTTIGNNPAVMNEISNAEAFQNGIAEIFTGNASPITVEVQDTQGEAVIINPLVFIGAAQAIFFALFMASSGAASVIEERRDGTLQRLAVTPTPRIVILGGKMLGTFMRVLVQLVFLFIAFTLVGSLIVGELQLIWGSNIPAIIAVLLATSAAATGLGTIIAAASNTPEQAGTIGSIIAIAMGVLGGAFGFTLNLPVEQFSIIYWGTQAFTRLAQGSTDILTHVIVLAGAGLLMFAAGLAIFNRRLSE